MFSKKAIKVDEIFTGDLTVSVKLSVKILSNVVAFLENTNFRQNIYAHNTVSFTKKKFAFCSPFKNIYGKKIRIGCLNVTNKMLCQYTNLLYPKHSLKNLRILN